MRGAAVDEIGNCFGFSQVDLAVEKRALGKFARPRQTCTQSNGGFKQAIHHYGSAMTLQFKHVFASEGVRRGKVEGETHINDSGLRIAKGCEVRHACGRKGSEYAARNVSSMGTRHAHDADAAPSGGSCDGCNGVGINHNAGGGALLGDQADAARSIVRVMYHCCAIDNTLLTTQYNTNPEGKNAKKNRNTNGSAIITFC